jgi:hypothetical protein
MDGEIVDALLGLLDQRVAKHFPRELLGLAVDFLEGLVNRHRADRHRRIADDPFARLVDVLAGRQVHHGVAAPARRPRHLLDFLGDRARQRRVADIGVDLHEEVAPDDHGLRFRMIDVRRNDRAAARDFVAHEFRRHHRGNRRAETLARVLARDELGQAFAPLRFADRDVFHFGRDDAFARVMHLRNVHPGLRAPRMALEIEAQFRELRDRRRGCGRTPR